MPPFTAHQAPVVFMCRSSLGAKSVAMKPHLIAVDFAPGALYIVVTYSLFAASEVQINFQHAMQ